jgi:hypothetical protein
MDAAGPVKLAHELAALLRRDLTKLVQELSAFPDGQLWERLPGVANSAGNLALHLEGNLREYIGRQLGGIAFKRERPLEFSTTGLPLADLVSRIEHVKETIPEVVAALSAETLDATYPENVLGVPLSTKQFIIHLLGHLNYHLGQINYLRRILTAFVARA